MLKALRSAFFVIWVFFIWPQRTKAFVTENYIIQKQSQSITFPRIANKTCADSVFSLGATASSGLDITYNVLFGNALVSGNIVTITGPGTVIIQAEQPGDFVFDAAPSVTVQFEVSSSYYSSNEQFIVSIKSNCCEGDTLYFNVSSFSGISYEWINPTGKVFNKPTFTLLNVSISNSGVYYLNIREAKCIYLNQSYNIIVHPKPVLTITGILDTVSISNSSFTITALPKGGILTGNGIMGDTFNASIAGLGGHTIIYALKNENNCSSTLAKTINVVNDPLLTSGNQIRVYELITSRTGSHHNVWQIDNITNFANNEVFVYDAWGDVVYTKKGYNNDWGGEGVSAGSYIYIVKTDQNATPFKGTLYINK